MIPSEIKSVLTISDGQHVFRYLLVMTTGVMYLYNPDHNHSKYMKPRPLLIQIGPRELLRSFEPGVDIDVSTHVCVPESAVPCAPFRYEGETYSEYWEIPNKSNEIQEYASLHVLKTDGGIDPDFIGSQVGYPRPKDIKIDIPSSFTRINHNSFVVDLGSVSVRQAVKEMYNPAGVADDIEIVPQLVVSGENDIYWQCEGEYDEIDGHSVLWFSKTDAINARWPYTENSQWTPDLKFTISLRAVCQYVYGDLDSTDPTALRPDPEQELYDVLNMMFYGQPFPITQELFGQCIQNQAVPELNLEDMQVNHIRLINKSIQNVINMTAETDSKANIIQPVFFRVRELASAVFHPAVTENVCINLDAYKSACESFYIKIEGVVFEEIARTESGIVFKIQGNMLPGAATTGTYYILDQDAELVTTGKYMYEY